MSSDKGSMGGQAVPRAPSHPVPQLQKPFEESMMESIHEEGDQDVPTDAMSRRTILLEAPTYQRVIAGRWKQKPGEKYHPLWKLVAQMSFGMHLLAKNMAISEEEVMRILQSHVDDIDAFLERTTEDFELAQSDVHERIRCLKLPLAHGDVFDRMLEDRAFRASILDGNEKIDHVISRTKRAAKDALKDVQKGFDATNVLEKYLAHLHTTWRRESPEHEAVLVAMLGNVEGWRRAFLELHLQGNKLAGSLKKLNEVVAEMQRRAAAVSRTIVAKAQRAKHITTQDAGGRVQSQISAVADHKPLPTEPGQHRSTRNSSRSTQFSGFSSRPNSGHKSSQGLTSQSASGGHQSPQSPTSKRLVRPEPTGRTFSSGSRALDESRRNLNANQIPSIGGLLIHSEEDHLIELPADVPEEALRQAPVSIKNRLSMTLGLKPRDNASHRISSIYYPKALGDLLKSPAMSSLVLTPPTGKPKGTPVQAVTSPTIMSVAEADYFISQEQSPSIGVITPDSKTTLESTKTSTPTNKMSARASIVELPRPDSGRSSVRNPAFTSHPVVMAMAIPPAELPAAEEHGERDDRPSSPSSRKESQPSSLGEPGPELTDGRTTRSVSISETRVLVDDSIVTVSVLPASAEVETFAAAEERVEKDEQLQRNKAEASELPEQIPIVLTDLPQDAVATNHPPEEVVIESVEDDCEPAVVEEPDKGNRGEEANQENETPHVEATDPTIESERSTNQFVAELEAIVPQPQKPVSQTTVGLVELDAQSPQPTFKLPPRPDAVSKNPEKEIPRASINNVDDFFKLPTELTIKPGMKPKDFGDSKSPEPIRPLKLKLEKKDGKIVPVQISKMGGRRAVGNASTKLRMDVVADIIETMSHTPPGSPLRTRSASSVSANSAQRWSHRSTRSLGPPQQAPPPPGPGGPAMVNPDFAEAGQFEGERKQKKKNKSKKPSREGKIGSRSGWKSFFGGSANSGAQSSKVLRTSASEGSEAGPSAEMMTTSGKDVVWFKGEVKNPVGISSA